MGKALKSSIPSQSNTFARKGLKTHQNKNINRNKRLVIINNYINKLSSNFGKSSLKRKHSPSSDCEYLEVKKHKSTDNEECTYQAECGSKITTNTKFEYKLKCLQSDNEIRDLFYVDELKNSNEHTIYVDWLFHLYDEISLEGLDGITIDALWTRLKNISIYPVLIHGKEEIIWNLMKSISSLEYFILGKPRSKLVVHDRNSTVCPDTGIVLEPVMSVDDIYPYSMVNRDGIKGSCSMYFSRLENTDIVKNLSLDGAMNIYGERLVIVASQKMRENAIVSKISNPGIELVDNEYGLLERVGRSRKHGELTQGQVSVLSLIKDSRSIFHIRKSLEKKKLLKKQFFILRNLAANQNKTGKLLHLPRFYRTYKSKTLLLVEEVVEFLRQRSGFSIEFGEFKKYFPKSTGVNKIMKMPEFIKYVKTNIFRPYRSLYPNAPTVEWKCKNKEKEKLLRIFQLIDPTVNVSASWLSQNTERDSDDECNDDETQGSKHITPEFLKEVFSYIFSKGKEGTTLQELEKNIELDYYTIRIAIRKLQAKNVIDSVKSEHGKQRHIFYFARSFHSKDANLSPVSQQMQLPKSILDKVLESQVNANGVDSRVPIYDTMINDMKYIINTSLNVPFHCQALAKKIISIEEVTSHENESPSISAEKLCSLDLGYEITHPKFCEVFKRHKRRIKHLSEHKNTIIIYTNSDMTMKLLFLRSLIFNDIDISDLLKNVVNKDIQENLIDFESLTFERKNISSKTSNSYTKEQLLGPDPVILYNKCTSDNIGLTIFLSTPPKEYIFDYSSYVTFDKNLTSLSVFRTNTILKLVKENSVMCDIYNLKKSIIDIEMETYEDKIGRGKIDKSTLNRLLVKLATEGYIKIFKFVASLRNKMKTQWIIAHPSVELTHPMLQSAQKLILLKFFLGMDRGQRMVPHSHETKSKALVLSPFDDCVVASSVKELKEISEMEFPMTAPPSKLFGRSIGYQPKFVRLQLLHELLFYLIYDYDHNDHMSHDDIEPVLEHYRPHEFRDIPPIYRKGIDWKMFIPPLPVHKSWGQGWALLCDVILALPLSIWIKIIRISFDFPALLAYVEHPVKKHYLIKHLPAEFRQVLMFQRRYIFCVAEAMNKLGCMGLVQLGPQSSHAKDQMFLYLNKNASLLDTSISEPSFHKITEQNYKRIDFTFSSQIDVEDYWYHLYTISMNAPPAQKRTMEGRMATVEHSTDKPILLDLLKPKTPEEALLADNGEIPGDKQGAAGLDSSMWSHIKRNWIWCSKGRKNRGAPKKQSQTLRNANIESIKPVSIKYKELINHNRKVYHPIKTRTYSTKKKRPKNVNRKIITKKATLSKQNQYICDAKDKMILKKVGKTFRASWTQKEDKVLHLCKAASYFLYPDAQKEFIPMYVVRDILHILCPVSLDKTTAACIRRMSRLRKMDPTLKRIKEKVSNLMNLKELSEYFSSIVFNITKTTSSKYIIAVYVHLVFYMYKNFEYIQKILHGHIVTRDYFAPHIIEIFSPMLIRTAKKKSNFTTPATKEAVKKEVIRSVLLSYLNSAEEGRHTYCQFFKICKQYPDFLLRSAVISLKKDQVLSISSKQGSKALNIKSMPFRLSITYSKMLTSTYSALSLNTIYQNHLQILGKSAKFAELDPSNTAFKYSRLLARNEISSLWSDIEYIFNIPHSAHILNPYKQDREKLTFQLAVLYQQYVRQKVQDRSKMQEPISGLGIGSREFTTSTAEKEKQLELIRNNISRLLTSIPCFCNKNISSNFSTFMETKDEEKFNEYLSEFLKYLVNIALNLFDTLPDGQRLLVKYVNKFHHTKRVVGYVSKLLELQICKVTCVIKQVLKDFKQINIKECFERECTERDPLSESVINNWLKKIELSGEETVNKAKIKTVQASQEFYSFFKYRKVNTSCTTYSTNSLDGYFDNMETVPEVDQIINEMMIPPDSNVERKVPHITDLAYLLFKDKLPDLEKDEKFLDELRSHFILQYPVLDEFVVENVDGLNDLLVSDDVMNADKRSHFQQGYQDFVVETPDKTGLRANIKKVGGTAADILLSDEIITFVYNKGTFGASGPQLKTAFNHKVQNLDLSFIVNIIVAHYIFLRTGNAELLFVHTEFSSIWLVETFHLAGKENGMMEFSEEDTPRRLQEKIEYRMKSTPHMKVLLMPWIRIDGVLNYGLLEKWLTVVLSFCLEFPSCPVTSISERFHLIRPVELYYLLEVLQDLDCLSIMAVDKTVTSLFSLQEEVNSRPATHLDAFEDMHVEVHTLSATCMGFYIDKDIV